MSGSVLWIRTRLIIAKRMKWYVIAQTILSMQWHTTKKQQAEAKYWHQYLQRLLTSDDTSEKLSIPAITE